MSADTDTNSARPNGVVESDYEHIPSTPPDNTSVHHSLSQQTIISTEGPNSPIDPSISFKTELNDDRTSSSQVIPSSLTPPPSSQVPQTNGAAGMPLGYISSQRTNMFSPPTTALRTVARDGSSVSEFIVPTSDQIADASAEELRAMVQNCLAENARLKMETAHHKLQYNLLSMQADEDAKRATVEHEMTRREVEVLRMTENSRQARRELNAASDSTQVKYRELQAQYEILLKENEALQKRVKYATKFIQQQGEEHDNLVDERDMLLNRIRENREHFHMLCSPGGAFHGALTPKTPAATSPQQHRATPRQTPRSVHKDARHDHETNQDGFAALLQALSHDNSAPSTPTAANRATLRAPPRHTRGAQSLSSLPTTPVTRARGDYSGLLPSVDLVPQTEPPNRYGNSRFTVETPVVQKRGRQSRESTISADDNEEIDCAALKVVAAATQSYMSQGSQGSQAPRRREDEEEVFESQASQAASEMLRRDPRESFEVASSVGSRDGTPAPAEKTAKLQSKLFAGINKAGFAVEKRKFNTSTDGNGIDSRRESAMSPAKKVRYGGGNESNGRVGLGIRYGHEA
ncbi:uncharacterized protein GGS25DRAFT_497185 [Hypoxylon fragiforme]|uniref:uncharacterized protein n=1 Tax=Hypoxylon fragiforme TaxID=63214 RepID=UPI0020C5C2C0|nr:uncharacterized protein GGS25DRAFT_497185 [Hypoxylon fragiforme]KAI2607721.1 hypothetical protein GGS25DRAFT_497185 [Hypoxylon fragiforme]